MPIVYILTLLLLLVLSFQQCAPSLYSLNLTTGILQFSSTDLQNNRYTFTFNASFSSVPQVAIAITHITTDQQASFAVSQFFAFVQSITSRAVQIQLNTQGSAWRVSRVSLLASTNSQLLVGSASLPNLNPGFGSASPNLQFQIPLNSTLPVNANQIGRGFLNGAAWQGQLNSATIASTVFIEGKITVNMNVQTQAGQLNTVWLSFIVFNLNNVEFAAYGGYVSIVSGSSQTVDLIKGFSAVQNVFFGINALQLDQKTPSSQLSLQSSIDTNFLLSYASQTGNFVMSYLFLGYSADATCSACKTYGMSYFLNGTCTAKCSGNTVPVSLSNGGLMCRACPVGTGLTAINGSCICPDSSTLKDGKCTPTQNSLSGLKVGFVNPLSVNSSAQQTVKDTQIIIPTNKSTYQITSQTQTTTQQMQLCRVINSFFNGNECVCIVGYIYSNGQCILPSVSNVTTPLSPNTTQTCPQNSAFNGSVCVCNSGFSLSNGICVQRVTCSSNAQDNGLGTCICRAGFSMINGICQLSTLCPSNSSLIGQNCVCNNGFYNISGACSQCLSGAFWSAQTQKCIYVCGINSIYNQTAGRCVCNPGFGRDANGTCVVCSINYFLQNDYCVTCPVNSIYNSSSNQCVCPTGYMLTQQGNCIQKCGANQVYNTVTSFCDCLANFQRVGNVCNPCPVNSYFSNGQCSSCPPNSNLVNKKCICISGYAADNYGVCQPCSLLPNTFVLNGFCVMCSGNQVLNTSLGLCQCPQGKKMSAGMCVSLCNLDEILDKSGNCFTCGMNEVVSQNVCTCKPGFIRNSCGACILNCPLGSFAFMGSCGTCPMNMNYLPQIGGCVCPNNYYMDPILNVCVASPFIQPNCSSGTFYDNNTQRCISCTSTCVSCISSTICTACVRGLSLSNGYCLPVCGDGIIAGAEGCDPGSSIQQGCINCQVVTGYVCSGQPSVCAFNQTNTPNNTTPNNTAKLSLKGNISLNSNNIFLTLVTTPTFTFPNSNVMQSFIQSSFFNTIRPTTYCMQQPSPNLNNFDCLLIYPSGVPNTKFNVIFYYNYLGQAANLTLTIDPLLYANTARTTQPVPTRPTN